MCYNNRLQNITDSFYCYSPDGERYVYFNIFWDDTPFNSSRSCFAAELSTSHNSNTKFSELKSQCEALVCYNGKKQREIRWLWSEDSRFFYFVQFRRPNAKCHNVVCLDFENNTVTFKSVDSIPNYNDLEPPLEYSLAPKIVNRYEANTYDVDDNQLYALVEHQEGYVQASSINKSGWNMHAVYYPIHYKEGQRSYEVDVKIYCLYFEIESHGEGGVEEFLEVEAVDYLLPKAKIIVTENNMVLPCCAWGDTPNNELLIYYTEQGTNGRALVVVKMSHKNISYTEYPIPNENFLNNLMYNPNFSFDFYGVKYRKYTKGRIIKNPYYSTDSCINIPKDSQLLDEKKQLLDEKEPAEISKQSKTFYKKIKVKLYISAASLLGFTICVNFKPLISLCFFGVFYTFFCILLKVLADDIPKPFWIKYKALLQALLCLVFCLLLPVFVIFSTFCLPNLIFTSIAAITGKIINSKVLIAIIVLILCGIPIYQLWRHVNKINIKNQVKGASLSIINFSSLFLLLSFFLLIGSLNTKYVSPPQKIDGRYVNNLITTDNEIKTLNWLGFIEEFPSKLEDAETYYSFYFECSIDAFYPATVTLSSNSLGCGIMDIKALQDYSKLSKGSDKILNISISKYESGEAVNTLTSLIESLETKTETENISMDTLKVESGQLAYSVGYKGNAEEDCLTAIVNDGNISYVIDMNYLNNSEDGHSILLMFLQTFNILHSTPINHAEHLEKSSLW